MGHLFCWSTAQSETRRVAGNGDGYGTVTCAVLNNSGVVLFTGERVASSGERFRGIYKGNSGVTTLMEDSVDHPPAGGQLQLVSLDQAGISMNNGGVASWYRWRGAFSKLVVYKSAGSVARANFAFDTDKTVGLGQTTVTDDGYLAYDTIVRSLREGEFAWAQQFPVGSLNNKHQYLRDESGKWAIIELGFKLNDPHQLQPVQTNLTTLSSQQVFVMTMNDSGTIAFWASQQNGSTFTGGIYRYSRGHTVPVVEVQLTNNVSATEFTFENGFPAFAINNNDQVVFYGKSRTLGREGFFRGTNPLSDKIVAIGDVVDGEPLTFLRAPNNAGRRLDKWLNDRGEIVFVGAENNTTSGLYVTSGVQSPPSAASAVVRYNPPVSPPSSSFGVASNWQPLNGDAPRVPQKTTTLNDTALFDRPEVYTVDFNGNHEHVERVLVKNGNVLFLNGSINADALSFQEPSLTVDNARLDVGTAMGLTNNHAIIGSSAASRVDVGTGGRWRSFGSLQVGAGGEGILNIDPGGTVQSGEGRIGTGAAGGKAIVGKDGLWDSGNLAVGAGGKGEMTIQGGGKVDSSTGVDWA